MVNGWCANVAHCVRRRRPRSLSRFIDEISRTFRKRTLARRVIPTAILPEVQKWRV